MGEIPVGTTKCMKYKQKNKMTVQNVDLFVAGINFSSTHSSRCGTATGGANLSSQQSPVSMQGSPMNTSTLGMVEESNER